jgi:hypothetical protein
MRLPLLVYFWVNLSFQIEVCPFHFYKMDATIDSDTKQAIAKAYAKEKSLRSVAKQFGVAVETVRRCLSTKGEQQ